jgi:hypothetical protein
MYVVGVYLQVRRGIRTVYKEVKWQLLKYNLIEIVITEKEN